MILDWFLGVRDVRKRMIDCVGRIGAYLVSYPREVHFWRKAVVEGDWYGKLGYGIVRDSVWEMECEVRPWKGLRHWKTQPMWMG